MNILIVGGGAVGDYLCERLLAGGANVRLIEYRASRYEELKRKMPPETLILGNATITEVLETARIHEADVVAAVTGLDETNLVVMTLARFSFHVARTVARINDPRHAWMFTPDMGVDIALNQADFLGHVILEEISPGNLFTLLKLQRGEFSLVEDTVHPDSVAAGKTVSALDLPDECVLTAILRDRLLIIPKGNTVLLPGDVTLAVAHASALPALSAIIGQRKNAP